MMKKRVLCGVLVVLLTGLQGQANDAGGLVYPVDYPHRARTELMYERVQRGVEITSETPISRRGVRVLGVQGLIRAAANAWPTEMPPSLVGTA